MFRPWHQQRARIGMKRSTKSRPEVLRTEFLMKDDDDLVNASVAPNHSAQLISLVLFLRKPTPFLNGKMTGWGRQTYGSFPPVPLTPLFRKEVVYAFPTG